MEEPGAWWISLHLQTIGFLPVVGDERSKLPSFISPLPPPFFDWAAESPKVLLFLWNFLFLCDFFADWLHARGKLR